MNKVFRHQTKLRKVGNSHVVTVPARTRWLWDLEDGSPVVQYQIGQVLLMLPLDYLPANGVHPLVRRLIEEHNLMDH